MYSFFYKEDGFLNKYTFTLAGIGVVAVIVGLAMMVSPGIKAAASIIKNQPQKMKLIVLEPEDCNDCFDISQVTDFISQAAGIKFAGEKEYAAGTDEAKNYIQQYNITVLPTFILQGNIEKSSLKDLFDPSSIAFSDAKNFVYANQFPPYYDLSDNKVHGEFSLTYLTDQRCDQCYDVYLHDVALSNLVMSPSASSTIDVSSAEGKKLLNDYKIQYVPTIILKGDLDAYQNFKDLWATVGTVEKDGTYVFRQDGLKLMGAYKNLWTGKLENAETSAQ